MKITLGDIKMKIKVLDDKKTKAMISLDFGDFIVKGFRVSESKFPNKEGEMLWLLPPSYLGGGRYHPIFFMPDKEMWSELESLIWKEYKTACDLHHKKRLGVSDEDWSI
jgi:hypothetical protein